MQRRIDVANAEFQVIHSLVNNRRQRHQRRQFVVQGVRPISRAVAAAWPLSSLIVNDGVSLSVWAKSIVERAQTPVVRLMAPHLVAALADKEGPVELLAIAEIPDTRLSDLDLTSDTVLVALDRPSSPGNLGTIIRSADAFGPAAVLILGHAADPYDPQSVRASTGSIFAVPVVAVPSISELADWTSGVATHPRLVAASEDGDAIGAVAMEPPVMVLLGNEARGLSRAARDRADQVVAIPMSGTLSSLNVATAASILLYEIRRFRRASRDDHADDR